MKVCVVGLQHLGAVTAACLAQGGHQVIGLQDGQAMCVAVALEPGLTALLEEQRAAGHLHWSDDLEALLTADVVWVTYDTPVNADDVAEPGFIVKRTKRLFPYLPDHALVLISSQVPVGTTRRLQALFRDTTRRQTVDFAYVPENLRHGSALDVCQHPDRVIIGTDATDRRETLAALFAPFTDRLEWMSLESAEMTKHAINAFLGMSIAFINEIAALCVATGADSMDVSRGLKTEARIGPKAYLRPGEPFTGGTLGRDLVYLADFAQQHAVFAPLVTAIKASNDARLPVTV